MKKKNWSMKKYDLKQINKANKIKTKSMSIKDERKRLQRERSKEGHALKRLHREEKKTERLIGLDRKVKTSREGIAILSWVLFGAFSIILGASAIEMPNTQQLVVDQASVQDSEICSLRSVDCDNEPVPDEQKAEELLAGTPMAGLGDTIVRTANEYEVSWKMIIGIAEAESNRGASYWHPYDHNCFNAWGIKPPTGRRADGSYLRCYYDWDSGIRSIAALLARRYKDQTPEEMCGVYVQPCNQSWLNTVNKYLNS